MIRHLRVALAFASLLGIHSIGALAATLTFEISGCTNPTWNTSTNPPTLVCEPPAQSGPPTCSSLTSTSNTPAPGAAFTLTATCTAPPTQAITQYQFFTNNANPDDTTGGNISQTLVVGTNANPNQIQFVAPAAAGDSKTYYVRARNVVDWSASPYQSRTITATTQTVSAPTNCRISPSTVSLTAGQSQAFSVTCDGEQNPTFAWVNTGGTATTAANARGFSVNYPTAGTSYSVGATVCNEGSACAAQVTRAVSVSAAGNEEFPLCTNIANTVYIPSRSVYQTALATSKSFFTNDYTNFNGTTALVYAFRTPSSPTSRLTFSLAEYGGSPTGRAAFIATSPCVKRGSAGVIAESYGNTVTLKLSVGQDSAYGYPRIETNTVYYITVYNQDSNGNTTCNLDNCPGLSSIQVR